MKSLLQCCVFVVVAWTCLLLCDGFVLHRHGRPPRRRSPTRLAVASLEMETAPQEHQERLQADNKGLVQISGYCVAKRSFGESFCFLDLVADRNGVVVQAMLKRQAYQEATSSSFDGIMKSLAFGTRIQVTGPVAPTRNPGEALVLIEQCRLLAWPRNPQHVKKILQVMSDGLLSTADIPLSFNKNNNDEIAMRLERNESLVVLAKEIVASLPDDPDYPEANTETNHNLPKAPLEIVNAPEWIQHDDNDEPLPLCVSDVIGLDDEASSRVVSIESAWIQNRRRFQGNRTVLEIVDDYERVNDMTTTTTTTTSAKRLKCVLHPTLVGNTTAGTFGQILAPGSQVGLSGFIHENVLWITELSLVQCSWRPSVVQYLLELLHNNDDGDAIDVPQAAAALHVLPDDLAAALQGSSRTQRQWYARQVSAQLQDAQSRMANIAPEFLQVLDSHESVRRQYKVVTPSTTAADDDNDTGRVSDNSNKKQFSIEGSRWKRQKEPQLHWMTDEVERLVQNHWKYKQGQQQQQQAPIRILDIGGGQGFLANAMAERLLERYNVDIQVVDIADRAVKNGRMRSLRKGYDRISYTVGDASSVELPGDTIDIVVALHACGTLTDVALGHALRHKASFVVCPCCYQSNPHLQIPGFPSVEGWLGVESAPYHALKLLAEVQGDHPLASQAMHTICSLRAQAVETHAKTPTRVVVKTFPVAYSTRNYCLVGNHID